MEEIYAYIEQSNVVIWAIGTMIALFIVAIIRYLFDRSGGYF